MKWDMAEIVGEDGVLGEKCRPSGGKLKGQWGLTHFYYK
jgi:hypothetical protein